MTKVFLFSLSILTATIVTVLGGAQGNAIRLQSLLVEQIN